jgi:hypothetical protein
MIDRPAPRRQRQRSARERQQLRAIVVLSLGLILLLTPLFMHPSQRPAFDFLLSLGWGAIALGAFLQWRVPVATPAFIAQQFEAELVMHRRVRNVSESAIGALRLRWGSGQ